MTIKLINKFLTQKKSKNQGFTLVETVVAMVLFAAIIGGLAPLMMVSRTFALQSSNRIGAIAVAQEIMDSLRQGDVSNMPLSGTTTTLPAGNSIANLPYKGKIYSATVTYCEVSSHCDATTRHLKVSVYQDGDTAVTPSRTASVQPIYQLETIYVRLQ